MEFLEDNDINSFYEEYLEYYKILNRMESYIIYEDTNNK